MVLAILDIVGGDKDCVVLTMVGGQYVLIAATSPYVEASNVLCVHFRDRIDPNVRFLVYGEKGIRHEHFSGVGRRFGLGFFGADAFPSLGNMNLDSFVGGR